MKRRKWNRLRNPLVIRYLMHQLFRFCSIFLIAASLFMSTAASAQTNTQSKPNAKSKKQKQSEKTPAKPEASLFDVPVNYYRIAGLGSTEGDSVNTFPYPTAIIQVVDTSRTKLVVRFPGLGMLGVREDTLTTPTYLVGDTLFGYEPPEPLYLLTFPKTSYIVFVDVWSKDGSRLLDSRPLAYSMNVEKYKTASLNYIHDPTTGMGTPTLRRRFQPTLLPFSIETNPGWRSTETLDSNMVYALVFRDPTGPASLAMSLTMRPALIGRVDSAMWESFKDKARMAFGSKGVAVNSIGDFQVDDTLTRRFIKEGYEFVSKDPDGGMEYVAAFLTPRAILMLLAPLDPQDVETRYQYYRAIARSLKLD